MSRLLVGTSGFAYAGWAPLFYPAGTRAAEMLARYAERLAAVELNNTFYRQPRPSAISSWLAATPAEFRFVVKAQRGGSMRAFGPAVDESLAWLTAPYRLFGDRLGAVLLRVPHNIARNDERLGRFLTAWPRDLPLAVEMQHGSWAVDEVHALLREHGAALCATDLDDAAEPDLRLTGRFIYLRLRRQVYTDADLARWADRLRPFLDAGAACFVFFRHDAHGTSALRAERLVALAEEAGGGG